jgi:hypothetical protein
MNDMLQKSKLAPELVIEREISYPPEQVFKAWTDQEALRLWMGPARFALQMPPWMPALVGPMSFPCAVLTAWSPPRGA